MADAPTTTIATTPTVEPHELDAVIAALAQRRPRIIMTVLLLTAFGLLMEILQARTTYRTFDLMDLWADAVGAAIGVILGAR